MWKKLWLLCMAALLACTMLAGCSDEKKPAGPKPDTPKPAVSQAPKEPPLASFKAGSMDAGLYELKGSITLPKLQQTKSSAAVTADSIYVIAAPNRRDNNAIKRIKFEGNKLLSIEDVGKSRDPYVYGNKKYAWFLTSNGKEDMLNVFDGKKLTTTQYIKGYTTPFGTVNSDKVYVEYGAKIIEGTIELSKFKEGKTLIQKWWEPLKARGEDPRNVVGTGKDKFYLGALAKNGSKDNQNWSTRAYEYSADGTERRGFDINAAKDQGVEVYPHRSNECTIALTDYVVFTCRDLVRVFNRDGGYVGEFNLAVDGNKLSVNVGIPMGGNDMLILCHEQDSKLYKLSF